MEEALDASGPVALAPESIPLYLGEGECRQADGNYGLVSGVLINTNVINAFVARQCLQLCVDNSDWCLAAGLSDHPSVTSQNQIWCSLHTDYALFNEAADLDTVVDEHFPHPTNVLRPFVVIESPQGIVSCGSCGHLELCPDDIDFLNKQSFVDSCVATNWGAETVLNPKSNFYCFTFPQHPSLPPPPPGRKAGPATARRRSCCSKDECACLAEPFL